jgi:hypothetical protein
MELDYPSPACTYTTPALTPELAMKMLELHRDTNHVRGGGGRNKIKSQNVHFSSYQVTLLTKPGGRYSRTNGHATKHLRS